MEPAVLAIAAPADAIAVILHEASRLDATGILALARRYPADADARRARTHVLDVASARDGRRDEIRRLKAAAASAIRGSAIATGSAQSLARLGALADAELAVQDAVLSILLSDRLGRRQADELAAPWLESR